MAQHDYSIANQSGQAFRQDLNNALAATVTDNSGASAPSTTYAYQIWIDTSTTPATIKRRDASNVSWITLGAVDGRILLGGNGIDFSGIQTNAAGMTGEVLNSYEEGLFTPTAAGATTAGVGTYTVQDGFYTRIGNRVIFNFRVAWTAHTGTGLLRLRGLPFASSSAGNSQTPVALRLNNLASPASTIVQGYVNLGTTEVVLESVAVAGGPAGGLSMDTAADVMVAGSYLIG
jgi:hypothetical protein